MPVSQVRAAVGNLQPADGAIAIRVVELAAQPHSRLPSDDPMLGFDREPGAPCSAVAINRRDVDGNAHPGLDPFACVDASVSSFAIRPTQRGPSVHTHPLADSPRENTTHFLNAGTGEYGDGTEASCSSIAARRSAECARRPHRSRAAAVPADVPGQVSPSERDMSLERIRFCRWSRKAAAVPTAHRHLCLAKT